MSDIKKNLIFIFQPPHLARYQWVGSVWPIRTRWQSYKYTNTGGGDYCSYPLSDLVSANRCLEGCGGGAGGGTKDIQFLWLVFIIVFQREFGFGSISLEVGHDWHRLIKSKQNQSLWEGPGIHYVRCDSLWWWKQ